jgi:CRISPR/Cas system-associated exonuclease Cas4 (RecB family)
LYFPHAQNALFCLLVVPVTIVRKTGKESEDDRKQLALYALYLSKEHSIPIDDIVIRNEYLLSGTSREYVLTQFDIEAAKQVMNESIYSMQQFLEDKAYNKPLDIEYFETNTTMKCNSCNYKEKCVTLLCI